MNDIDAALDNMMTGALTIYDVAKALPHPYDAVADMANHWAHDFVGVARQVQLHIAALEFEVEYGRKPKFAQVEPGDF